MIHVNKVVAKAFFRVKLILKCFSTEDTYVFYRALSVLLFDLCLNFHPLYGAFFIYKKR
jgi:hypothetical protein